MESVRSLKPQPRKGGRGLGVLLCSLVAWGSLGFVAGSGAHPRPRTGPGGNVAVGHLVGGIYKVGGPAPPYGCYDKRCPSGGRVTVRNRHGAIVARETLNKAGQKFRFRLIPGRYAVKASCGGSQPKRVRVVAGRTTRANLYCGIR
jgi:hypothetical protein